MKTLDEIELFNERTIGNVPSAIFFLTIFICLFVYFVSIFIGLVFTLIFIPTAFYVHKDDPHVITVFIKSFSLSDSIEHISNKPLIMRKVK